MDKKPNIDAYDFALTQQLRQRRELLKMSQTEASAALQSLGIRMSQTALSRIEKGQRALTFGEARAYASVLGTTLNDLNSGTPHETLRAEARAAIRQVQVTADQAFKDLGAFSSAIEHLYSQMIDIDNCLSSTDDYQTKQALIRVRHELDEIAHVCANEETHELVTRLTGRLQNSSLSKPLRLPASGLADEGS